VKPERWRGLERRKFIGKKKESKKRGTDVPPQNVEFIVASFEGICGFWLDRAPSYIP
jgi:hypothetical protein